MAQNWNIKGGKFVFPKAGKHPIRTKGTGKRNKGPAMDMESKAEQHDEIGDDAGGEMGHGKGKACPMCGK